MVTDHVVSLVIAKKLQAAGFRQDTEFCWRLEPIQPRWFVTNDPDNLQCSAKSGPAAPLLSEILTEFPKDWVMTITRLYDSGLWFVDEDNGYSESGEGTTAADAAAQIWLWYKTRK